LRNPSWLTAALLLLAAACAGQGPSGGSAANGYEVTIRRDGHGVPHVLAHDWGSLGYGEGFAFAQDHACTLADQVVRARGDRARYFGRGERDAHLNSDLVVQALGFMEDARRELDSLPRETRAWVSGYAAGYNRYLAETPVDRIPGWCRGAAWVGPIGAVDIVARWRLTILVAPQLVTEIATAAPPSPAPRPASSSSGLASSPPVPALRSRAPGNDGPAGFGLSASNAWAIGAERSAGGRGMLLANPHWFWTGSGRFWEKHLTIPGEIDVYGVNELGAPGVGIGFNHDVAWTHTVSAGKRFTFYALALVPGDPTSYLYDGAPRRMRAREVRVPVREPNGTLSTAARTLYFSHYGPLLNLPGVGWTGERAVTYRDANVLNTRTAELYLALGRARSLDDLKRAHAQHGGPTFVNTIAASADGRAWFADASSAPSLSAAAIGEWLRRRQSDPLTRAVDARGAMLLDGSDSRFEWSDEADPRGPGLVPFARSPQLERHDYLFNANDSAWLPHATARLSGFSVVHGFARTPRSLRTRMNARLLADASPSGPAGPDRKFSLEELAAVAFDNRGLAAELLRGPLVERCARRPRVAVGQVAVDLADACRVLATWDGRVDLNSPGAVLWREFITRFEFQDQLRAGPLFAEAFDPERALETPRGLADRDAILEALAHAVQVLARAGLAVDVPLGRVQYADRGGRRVPVHGGHGVWEGVPNYVNLRPQATTLEPDPPLSPRVEGSRLLTTTGYPITGGTSFVMVMEFTERGPRALALLVSGQSGDPTSPRFWEQTEMFAAKRWRHVRFSEEEIQADRGLTVTTLRGPRVP
jgi:acyl-homoserine-lactone acylase